MRYIFSLLLVVCLLLSAMPVGDGFIALSGGLHLDGMKILITEVHKPEWKIAYRYGVDCKPEDRQNGEALKEAISASLRTWLETLRELNPDRPIVDKFVYELQPDYDPDIHRSKDNLEGWRAVDLRVAFVCTPGRSGALIGRLYPPDIRIQEGTKVRPSMFYALVHELGHAFGLADTYTANRSSFMRSRGGLDWTSGNQPASVMAGAGNRDISTEAAWIKTANIISEMTSVVSSGFTSIFLKTLPQMTVFLMTMLWKKSSAAVSPNIR